MSQRVIPVCDGCGDYGPAVQMAKVTVDGREYDNCPSCSAKVENIAGKLLLQSSHPPVPTPARPIVPPMPPPAGKLRSPIEPEDIVDDGEAAVVKEPHVSLLHNPTHRG